MRPVTINPSNVTDALNEIMTASREDDIVEIASAFTGANFPALIPQNIQTFQVGNASNTTEATLASYVLPGGSLNTVNQGLVIRAAGYFGNNGTVATARVYFGSSVFTLANPTSDKSRWYAEMRVILVGTSPPQEFITAWGISDFGIGPMGDNPLIDVTSNVTIKVTGQSPAAGVANEVVGYFFSVTPLESDLVNVASTFEDFLEACQRGGVNRTT